MARIVQRLCTNLNRICYQNIENSFSKLKITQPALSSCSRFYSTKLTPYEIVDPKADKTLNDEIIKRVNKQVVDGKLGRLFAVVHVAGKQFKVTEGDVIVIEGYWPPNIGDKIRLEKVMIAGAADFTLIGRPIVQKGLVHVDATVIEKTLSHTKTHFRKKRRKQYMRINFFRIPQTFLRINNVSITEEVNNPAETRGLETAIF